VTGIAIAAILHCCLTIFLLFAGIRTWDSFDTGAPRSFGNHLMGSAFKILSFPILHPIYPLVSNYVPGWLQWGLWMLNSIFWGIALFYSVASLCHLVKNRDSQ